MPSDAELRQARPSGIALVLVVFLALFAISPVPFLIGMTTQATSDEDQSFLSICLMGAGLVLFFLPPQLGFMLAAAFRWTLMKLIFILLILLNATAVVWWTTDLL